jgi:hypothetical protein
MNYAQDRLDRRAILLSVLQDTIVDDVDICHGCRTTANCNATTDESKNEDTNANASRTKAFTKRYDDAKYGQICMTLGWNVHALYHYGLAWYNEPTNCHRMADYAQMMELCGYPEIALITLFVYRALTTAEHIRNFLQSPHDHNKNQSSSAEATTAATASSVGATTINWYDQSANDMIGRHCGCGDPVCGSNRPSALGWIPISRTAMNHIVDQIQSYCHHNVQVQYQHQTTINNNNINSTLAEESMWVPTAHELLAESVDAIPQSKTKLMNSGMNNWNTRTAARTIPKLFQFWNVPDTMSTGADDTNDVQYRPLLPVVQLLCIKLLYLVLPSLAIEATVHKRLANHPNFVNRNVAATILTTMELSEENDLAIHYKSHWAYYIFIKSLVFGERIKACRRRRMKYQHISLWDRLWGISSSDDADRVDGRSNSLGTFSTCMPNRRSTSDCTTSHSATKTWEEQHEVVNSFIGRLNELVGSLYNDRDSSIVSFPDQVWLQPFLLPLPNLTNGHNDTTSIVSPRPLFILGDSHVLSLAWQFVFIPTTQKHTDAGDTSHYSVPRLIVPILITGLKAWHLRFETRFFTHTCLQGMLRRIPSNVKTIIISAGEIDCREGMGGPLLQGYTQECHGHVQATVSAYVSSLAGILELPNISISQILILPVAPHVQRKKGRIVGRASRRETMRVWNDELRRQLQPYYGTMYLLDYTDQLQLPTDENEFPGSDNPISTPYVLNPIFNADSTHMNSAFGPILERAIVDCGCDTTKI